MTHATTPWGKGKNQVHALKSEIIALLRKGESLESVFHILTDAKKLTIGARTFHRHAAAFRDEAQASSLPLTNTAPRLPNETKSASETPRKLAPAPPQPSKPSKPSKPKLVVQSRQISDGFGHKPDGANGALADAYGSTESIQPEQNTEEPKE